MLISAVIPTYKREAQLAIAVQSVLEQKSDEFDIEIIVVNDAGEPLKEADWQKEPNVFVYNTYKTERCFARNAGAALSKGDWIHFLDDDDCLVSGAYNALIDVISSDDIIWVYGAFELVSNDGELIDLRKPHWKGNIFAEAIAGDTIPQQASLWKREAFFKCGGFDPQFPSYEDKECEHRLSLMGLVEYTEKVICKIRFGIESSTSQWSTHDENGRIAREKAFDIPNSFNHIKKSLSELKDMYLRGRLCRYYIGSFIRNAKNCDVLKGISRLNCALILSFSGIFYPTFWKAMRD